MRFRVDVIIKRRDIRSEVVDYLHQEPEFSVEGFVGTNYNVSARNPSVVVLGDDVAGNGYQFALNLIRRKHTPIMLVTGIAQQVSDNDLLILDVPIVDTIDYGDVEFAKPIRSYFIYRMKVLCKLDISKFHKTVMVALERIQTTSISDEGQEKGEDTVVESVTDQKESAELTRNFSKKAPHCVVVIGSSAGGPQLVRDIVMKLPRNFPPVLVIQHMNDKFSEHFAGRLAKAENAKVKLAKTGDYISQGIVLVAPGGKHLEVSRSGNAYKVNITDDPPVNFVRPSVDVTLFSAIRAFDGKVVSVILSGMGADGREGSRAVKKFGGKVLALRKEDTPVYGMNRAVIESNIPDKIVSIDTMILAMKKAIEELQ